VIARLCARLDRAHPTDARTVDVDRTLAPVNALAMTFRTRARERRPAEMMNRVCARKIQIKICNTHRAVVVARAIAVGTSTRGCAVERSFVRTREVRGARVDVCGRDDAPR